MTGLLAGFIIGLVDGISSGRFLNVINGPSTSQREAMFYWTSIGALLGPILGAIVVGVYSQNLSPPSPETLVGLATCGDCFGLPGGAITGILFGMIYSKVMAFIVGAKD